MVAAQTELAGADAKPWTSPAGTIGGVYVCFGRGGAGPGAAGEEGWAGAASMEHGQVVATAGIGGRAGAPYQPGLLALREGAVLASAVLALPELPDVLVVNATGRDHPRRAGLALHLGAVLGVATIRCDPPVVAGDRCLAR